MSGHVGRPAGAALGIASLLASALSVSACHRKHVPVDSVPELGYPSCAPVAAVRPSPPGDDAGTAHVIARGRIRSGPFSNEKNVVESFELARTPCGYSFESRQEWPLDISDVRVVFDSNLAPVWAWKRMTIAGSKRADGNADIRRYELRTGDVFIKRRDANGEVTLEKLLPGGRVAPPAGQRVGAVVGPGRGLVTAWLLRAHLGVGGKSHELVLDFRGLLETLEMSTLERMADRFEPSLGRTVRVYTFYGKETVFADDNDVVIGDLAGMRPSDAVAGPEPEPLPDYGGADPVHTP